MNLLLVRHALAEERQVFAKKNKDDSLRPLTLKGRRRMEKVLMALSSEFKNVDVIVTSPYVRSQQTSLLIKKIIPKAKVFEAAELVPECPPHAFVHWMRSTMGNYKKVVVVGHDPQLSLLASYLLAGKTHSFIELKKSGIISLEVSINTEQGMPMAMLNWMIHPKLII